MIRQASAEDLDAAHQLVSSARAARDASMEMEADREHDHFFLNDPRNQAVSQHLDGALYRSVPSSEDSGAEDRPLPPMGQTCR